MGSRDSFIFRRFSLDRVSLMIANVDFIPSQDLGVNEVTIQMSLSFCNLPQESLTNITNICHAS